MPFDYVKGLIKNPDIKSIKRSNKLDFKGCYSSSTGAIDENKVIAEFHHCKITIYKRGRVQFSGSIHKMWNSIHGIDAPNKEQKKTDKGYNGNQFGYWQLQQAFDIIFELLYCEPQQFQFENVEYGINLKPSFTPQLFIKGLLMHMGVLFEFRFKEHYAQAVHARYILKIYNKSGQYGMKEHTLRVEQKFIKTEDLKKIGFKTAANINETTLNQFSKMLLEQFEKVLYYDYTIRKKELKAPLKKRLNRLSNPKYWMHDLKPNKRDTPKKELNRIIENHSNDLKGILIKEIKEKRVTINRKYEALERVTINSSNIVLNPTQDTSRKCSITGHIISMQKEGSFLLSHTGLKFLKKNNPEAFEKVKEKHLTERWRNETENQQIKKITHHIRLTYQSRIRKQKRLYPEDQLRLFNF